MLAAHFSVPLVDLGAAEDPRFVGVFTPAPEVGQERLGVDAVFLDNAEAYYRQHQGFGYWGGVVEAAWRRLGVAAPELIVEMGCGFGNATLPMLEMFPDARLIATDISPNLLAILRRLLAERGQEGRCLPVAMDAHRDYIAPGAADLVVGAAILHHLMAPERLIAQAVRMLKPGGAALFFEPMEGGYALLRKLCLEIAAEAERRKVETVAQQWTARGLGKLRRTLTGRAPAQALPQWAKEANGLRLLLTVPEQIAPQILRGRAGWLERNDKWTFSRSFLEAAAADAGAEVQITPLQASAGQFRTHVTQMLWTYGDPALMDLPAWAWEIVRAYDEEYFSPELLADMPLEASVTFMRRAG